jgi:DNA-binding PadR family transcriptional regulator
MPGPAPGDLPVSAYVILGMLRLGARSGYEVKRAVEVSVRFFWNISHAQIYPNLERLERDGLISGHADPQGRRPRRVYEVTPDGERALALWLHTAEPMPFEVRDLATLKLFFADALPPSEALALVHAIRLRSEETLARFERQSAPPARTADAGGAHYPLLSLRLGIAVHQALVDACDALERELYCP